MVFVSKVCKGEHDDGSKNVWWGNETLGSGNTEAHTVIQNDWQEVSDRVGVGCGETEESCETPDLHIESVSHVFTHVKFLWDGIVTVLLDSGHHECGLFLGKEFKLEPLPCRLLWEVCDEEVTG